MRPTAATLLLAKHAEPEILREVPPPLWKLSPRGRLQAAQLAESVRRHAPARIATSPEPKARETAEIVGAALGVGVAVHEALHEHERAGEPYFDDPSELRARVRTLFARPEALVFGSETAAAARARFRVALERIVHDEARESWPTSQTSRPRATVAASPSGSGAMLSTAQGSRTTTPCPTRT